MAHTTDGGIGQTGGEGASGARVSSRLLNADFLRDLEQVASVSKRALRDRSERGRVIRRGLAAPEARGSWSGSPLSFALGDDGRSSSADALLHLERLFHKLFTTEEDLSIHLILDGTQSMGYTGTPEQPTKFAYARRMAAALGYVALTRYGRVGVSAFGHSRGRRTPILRGPAASGQLFSYLEGLAPGGCRDFSRAALTYAQRVAEEPGVCILFSDFLDPHWERAIRTLFARRFRVVMVQVLDPEEVEPTFLEELRLVDTDAGTSRPLTMTPQVLARYRSALSQFCGQLSDAAGYQGMGYLRTTTQTEFEGTLLQTLRSGGLLR